MLTVPFHPCVDSFRLSRYLTAMANVVGHHLVGLFSKTLWNCTIKSCDFLSMKHRCTLPTIVSTDDTYSGSVIESIMHDMRLVASFGEEEDDGK